MEPVFESQTKTQLGSTDYGLGDFTTDNRTVYQWILLAPANKLPS